MLVISRQVTDLSVRPDGLQFAGCKALAWFWSLEFGVGVWSLEFLVLRADLGFSLSAPRWCAGSGNV
jgi:hypothetical protein